MRAAAIIGAGIACLCVGIAVGVLVLAYVAGVQ